MRLFAAWVLAGSLACDGDAGGADAGGHDSIAPTVDSMAADAPTLPDAGGPDSMSAADAAMADAAMADAATADAAMADANGDAADTCLPTAYIAYFTANAAVEAATFDRLDPVGQSYMCDYLAQLEASGELLIDEPAASAACVEPTSCTYILTTEDERSHILAAKYAHAVWLDLHGSVPWSLADYTAAELDGLFDPNVLLDNGTQFLSVVDYSPSQAWAYVVEQDLVATTIDESVVAVIADLRTTDAEIDFLHGIAGLGDPVSTAYTLDEALRTWVDRGGTGTLARIARSGCHSSSRIALGVTRSMNIPGVEVHNGAWFGVGHSTPTWPVVERVMPHGDDLYNATLRQTPAANLLAPTSFYVAPSNTAVCGADGACLGGRYAALNSVAYPANYTVQRCCNPGTYGYASCLDYLNDAYSSVLTTAEITAAEASLSALCN